MNREYDFRTKVVLNFIVVLVILGIAKEVLEIFHFVPLPPLGEARLLDRISGILACMGVAAFGVLLSVRFGIKHFKTFSRLDKILTRLPVGFLGLALLIFSSHSILTKPYDYYHAFGILDPVLLLVGSFLCVWVFLFYGRGNSGPAKGTDLEI